MRGHDVDGAVLLRAGQSQPGWRNQLHAVVGLLAVAVALAPSSAEAQSKSRVAILYGAASTYREAANALQTQLRNEDCECLALEYPASDSAAQDEVFKRVKMFEPQLIAASGTSATSRAITAIPDVPIIFFMVPNALDAPFLSDDAKQRERLAGVTADIDPRVQIDWIRKTLPDAKQVAVLRSDRSDKTVDALQIAAEEQGISIVEVGADRDSFPDAIAAITERDIAGVLMIADARVYNSPTVQRLLLWGVRRKKAIWAFSANVVKAGAFSGLQCEPASVGRQTAQIVMDVLRGKAPQEIGLVYPDVVDRSINVHTAKMIEVPLPRKLKEAGVQLVGESQ